MLSGPDATLDTQDTPGNMLQDDDTSEPRVLVLTTSIKCIFFAIQSQVLGYHGGVLNQPTATSRTRRKHHHPQGNT